MAKKKLEEILESPQSKKLAAIQKACAALQAKFGKESVNFLGNNKIEPIPRIPTGSIALDRITGGGYPLGRMIEIFGPASSGKCLTKDTMILTKEGYRSLEEIFLMNNITPYCTQKEVPCSFPLINMNGEEENTTHFVMNGKRKVYKTITQNGTVIKSTAKHPLRVITPNGYMIWKKTNELQKGDVLVGRIGGNYFSKKENNENEKIEASILGLIIADGYLSDKRIGFSNSNEELINYYKENYNKISEFNNVSLKEYKTEGRITTEFHLNSKEQISLFYNRMGLKSALAKDKFVPKFIFNGNETLQKTFLKFYFDCEASIEDNNINVSSASYKLLYQIKIMLSNMGIMTSLKPKKINDYPDNEYWNLYIFNNNIIKFNDKIGWFTKERNDKIIKFYEDKKFHDDSIPYIRKMLEEYYNSIDPTLRSSELYSLFDLDKRRENYWYSKSRLKEVLEATGDYANPWIVGALNELIDENISFEIIESIEEQDEIETFDFAMENTHSFIAEGIINHNTSLCYHAIAEAQKMFPDDWCGFVDSEHTFDPEYASNIGVNVAELMTAQPDSGTDAFAMVQGMIEAGAKLLVVDSVAAMVPREEMEEEDYGKNSIGLQARMMSKGLRKLASIAGKYKCVVIFTNQTRNKIGVMYGNPECVTLDTMVEVEFE